MTNPGFRTLQWRQELLTAIDNAAQLTVTPALWESVTDLWWSRCERSKEVFTYVFSALLGFPFGQEDLANASPRLRRGLYSFTSTHMFPGQGVYVAEIVAHILLEGRQEKLIRVYYNSLLRRSARLDHERVQRERDSLWIQEVLALFEEGNPSVRLLPEGADVGEGDVRQ